MVHWYKAWVRGRSLAGIAGSNPVGGMIVYRECCVLSGRGLCVGLITRQEESYWVWCVSNVWSWSLDNEEALAHYGLSSHRKKQNMDRCWNNSCWSNYKDFVIFRFADDGLNTWQPKDEIFKFKGLLLQVWAIFPLIHLFWQISSVSIWYLYCLKSDLY
jgi:hypothetical protein